MPTANSWNNQVTNANVTFAGGTMNIGADATSGAINIGTGAAARTTTIGNISGATAVNINTGSAGCTITTTNGPLNLISGTGSISVGADAVAKSLTIGNTTGASDLALRYGTLGYSVASASGTVINATSAGQVTKPLQPAFFAFKSSTTTNVTGNGAAYDIIFDTEVYDIGSNYNNATGVFTAPVAGIYHFDTSIKIIGCTIATACFLNFTCSTFGNITNQIDRVASANSWSPVLSADAKLLANETVTVRINVTGEAGNTDDVFGDASKFVWFCGRLVC